MSEGEFDPFDTQMFDAIIIDADTAFFRAAVSVEQRYIIATHRRTGQKKEFKTKTEFYGHHSKKAGGWLAELNEKRAEAGRRQFHPDEFDFEELVRPNPEIDDHIKAGVGHFDYFIKMIRKAKLANRYKILVAGTGNYRYDEAHTLQYKGKRKDKPIFFKEIVEAICKKYIRQVEVIHNREVDDQMAVYGFENLKHFRETGQWKFLLAYVDKDLKMISSPAINYDKLDEGYTFIDTEEAALWYCKQLLMGDKTTDNIQGLPDLPDDFKEQFGAKKGIGVGEDTADKVLADCMGVADMFERVCDAYIAYYGEKAVTFTTWRGEIKKWTWRDYLQETAMLIYMNPLDQPTQYTIKTHMKRVGVDMKKYWS